MSPLICVIYAPASKINFCSLTVCKPSLEDRGYFILKDSSIFTKNMKIMAKIIICRFATYEIFPFC